MNLSAIPERETEIYSFSLMYSAHMILENDGGGAGGKFEKYIENRHLPNW